MSSKGSNNKRNTTTRNALIAIAVLLVIAVIVFLVQSCNGKPGTDKQDGTEPGNPGIIYDSNAVEGGWNEADLDRSRYNRRRAQRKGRGRNDKHFHEYLALFRERVCCR